MRHSSLSKKTIVVEDISTDPLWDKYKHIAASYGLRACWSTPILDFSEKVLGTFALYYTKPRKPTSAALAIQNHNVKDDLKIYAEELKRSNSDLRDFAHIASHDLQEPLRKISIFSDRLQEAKSHLSEQHLDYLSRMGNAVHRMQALIDDLLQLSQATAKGKPSKKVDLAEIFCEVLEDLEARLMETQGKVTQGYLPSLDADPFQIRQLLQNLVENALKYHKPDTPLLFIWTANLTKTGAGKFLCKITESGWMKSSRSGFSSLWKDCTEYRLMEERELAWLSARRLFPGMGAVYL